MIKIEKKYISERYKYNGKLAFYLSSKQKESIFNFEKINSLKNKSLENCYICNSDSFLQISDKDKYWFYYPVVICKSCWFVHVNPYYNDNDVNDFYSNYFRNIYMWTNKTQKYIFENNIKRGNSVIKFIEEKTNIKIENKNVLDIWCWSWWILMAFKNRWNNCLWIDLWWSYFNEWLKNNLDLRQLSLDNYLKENNNIKYDIVIFSHNLEHLINPKKELEILKSIIHKDTIIFISVPGIFNMANDNYDLLNEYFQNAHKSHFSLNSLNNLMKVCGYNLFYWDEEIKSIFKLSKDKANLIYDDYNFIYNKLLLIEEKYKSNFYKIIFIKTFYFILDKFWLRILFLKFLNKIWLTKILRKILLNEK